MSNNKANKSKPLYEVIYEELKNRIMSGVYTDGEKLPFERELCVQYVVDRITVRRALKMLVSDGLLTKRPGLGSFVKIPLVGDQSGKLPSRNILFTMYKNSNEINSNPSAYNSELFYAINRECQKNNYTLTYSVLDEHFDLSNLPTRNHYAGIFFVSFIPDSILSLCSEMHIPAICINNRHDKLTSLVPEDEKGTYDAIRYLQSLGHSRIGILTGLDTYYSTKERLRGFYAAMASMPSGVDQNLVIHGDWTFSGARNAVLTLIENTEPDMLPTAIYCMCDIMAIGAMDALNERGIHVPNQISVLGFDNVQLSNYVSPRLTTISVDVNLMAKLAVEMVIRMMDSSSAINYVVQVPTSLVKRNSVAPYLK